MYSQDVQWMNIMYGEHMGIKCKIQMNQDYLTDEEETDIEDNPLHSKMDGTGLSEQDLKETFKDEAVMPPG